MMMKRLSPLAALLCASLLAGNAWSAAVENAKPKSRLAAKIKPETAIAPLPADEPALNEEQMAVGPRVHSGEVACEFNQKVQLTPHPDKPGRFKLQFGKMVYNMTPEPTSTGAVRLEDKAAGVVWLQIPTKSMLMNAKLGRRLVDSCQHADQVTFAKNLNTAVPEGGIGITPGTSVNN